MGSAMANVVIQVCDRCVHVCARFVHVVCVCVCVRCMRSRNVHACRKNACTEAMHAFGQLHLLRSLCRRTNLTTCEPTHLHVAPPLHTQRED